MLCSEFDSRVQDLLDERRAPELDAKLQSHARQCEQCRDQLEVLARLFGSLDLLEMPSLPSDFARRVVDSVVDPAHPLTTQQRSRDPSFLVAVAIALTLLLAAIPVGWQVLDRGRSVARPGSQDRPPAHLRKPDASQQLNTDQTDESWMVSIAIWEFYPEAARERHRQQVNEIADDLKPIATPFNAAMTAIRRSIPGTKHEVEGEPRASIQRHDSSRQIS